MSFWQTSDGDNAAQTEGEFQVGGGDPIPAKTNLKAYIDEAKWDEHEGDYFIALRWVVLEPEQYKNRKVFQKVRVRDNDQKKADRAKRMLAAIDSNAGGQLVKLDREPSDQDLATCLMNKPMMIQVQVWEFNGSSGNWVNKVSSANSQQTQQPQQPQQPQQQNTSNPPF